MKNKVVLLPLSLLVQNNQMDAVNAFRSLGVSKTAILMNWRKLNDIFERYRSGQLRTKGFRRAIGQIFPQAIEDEKKFDAAWNKGCNVTSDSHKFIQQLLALKDQGIDVRIVSNSNELHVAHILSQLKENQRSLFRDMLDLSYMDQKGAREMLPSVIEKLKNEYPKLNKNEVAMFYTAPKPIKYPTGVMGRLISTFDFIGAGWVVSPIQKLFQRQAQKYVTFIKTMPVTLVRFPRLKNVTLAKALEKRMGWKTAGVSNKPNLEDLNQITQAFKATKAKSRDKVEVDSVNKQEIGKSKVSSLRVSSSKI